MNSPNKRCCDRCLGIDDNSGDGIGGTSDYCKDPNCPDCHSATPTKTTDWRERFDAMAKKLKLRDETISGVDEYGTVRNFIADLLNSAADEIDKLHETIEPTHAEMNGYSCAIDDAAALLRAMTKDNNI